MVANMHIRMNQFKNYMRKCGGKIRNNNHYLDNKNNNKCLNSNNTNAKEKGGLVSGWYGNSGNNYDRMGVQQQ